jgi:hypothetical protein
LSSSFSELYGCALGWAGEVQDVPLVNYCLPRPNARLTTPSSGLPAHGIKIVRTPHAWNIRIKHHRT